jgi:hypothetical protein
MLPVNERLAQILTFRRNDPEGDPLGPDAYVFGNETGEHIEDGVACGLRSRGSRGSRRTAASRLGARWARGYSNARRRCTRSATCSVTQTCRDESLPEELPVWPATFTAWRSGSPPATFAHRSHRAPRNTPRARPKMWRNSIKLKRSKWLLGLDSNQQPSG